MINPDVEEIETVQLTDDVVDNEVLELDQNEEFQQVKQNFLQETKSYKGFNKSFIDFVRDRTAKHLDQKPELSKKVIKHLSLFDKVRKNSYKNIIPEQNLRLYWHYPLKPSKINIH